MTAACPSDGEALAKSGISHGSALSSIRPEKGQCGPRLDLGGPRTANFREKWRRWMGVEPTQDLIGPETVLKTAEAAGPLPSPGLDLLRYFRCVRLRSLP